MIIKEIISWINKNLKDIIETHLFKEYFYNIEIFEGINSKYLTNKSKGIEIVVSSEDSVITSIHLFSGKDNSYQVFENGLPFNIKFSYNCEDIHEIFGKPSKSGGGHKSMYMFIPPWEKYYFDNYSIHFQYSNGSIDKITIASLRLEEYFNSELQ